MNRPSKDGLACVFAALVLLLAACTDGNAAPAAASPLAVGVVTLAPRNVALYRESLASLDGYVNADIRARVRGYLRQQEYADGAAVKRGQLLFTIDAAEFRAATNAVKASLERARANRERARAEVGRDRQLARDGAISRQDLDNAEADVADAEARVHEAEAALERAQLDLSYTSIRSPLDGVAGIALVRAGNLVGADSSTLLTTVSTIDPIRVTFSIGELDFVSDPRLLMPDARHGGAQDEPRSTPGARGKAAPAEAGLELVLADGSLHHWRGKVVSMNRELDSSTGSIAVQALFPNPEGTLRPGQFGRVRLPLEEAGHGVLAVPDRALIPVMKAYSVAVVGPGEKIQLRNVELGLSSQGLQIIEKGLAAGERVVVDGVQKMTEGLVVEARPLPQAQL